MIDLLSRAARTVAFAAWFTGRVLLSTREVLVDVLGPGSSATPRVVRLPLTTTTAAQVSTLGALITLTPGTLTLGVVDGQHELLVHSMYHEDDDAALRELRHLEERMLAATGRGHREVAA